MRTLSTAIVLAATGQALAQATFQGIDPPPPGTVSGAGPVSADGSVAAGAAGWPPSVFRWTAAQGSTPLPGPVPEGDSVGISCLTADGSVAFGWELLGPQDIPLRWTGVAPPQSLPIPPGFDSAQARGTTSDGSVVVGSCSNSQPPYAQGAVRWRTGLPAELLPPLPGGDANAVGISGDGSVIVGISSVPGTTHAVLWRDGGVVQDLGTPAGLSTQAAGVSRDGRVVVGWAYLVSAGVWYGMKWEGGTGVPLPNTLGLPVSLAAGASADGSVITGRGNHSAPPNPYFAVVWTHAGEYDLRALLAQYGANVTGWALSGAGGVSDDGRTIVGSGTDPQGRPRGWIARLPEGFGCYANCDQSVAMPVLNVADFTCFLQRFAAGEPYANCDGTTAPPVLNVADFTCFLQRFAAGCP